MKRAEHSSLGVIRNWHWPTGEKYPQTLEITVSYLTDRRKRCKPFRLASWGERMSWETLAWAKVLGHDHVSHCAERAPKMSQESVGINSQFYLEIQVHDLFSHNSKQNLQYPRGFGFFLFLFVCFLVTYHLPVKLTWLALIWGWNLNWCDVSLL